MGTGSPGWWRTVWCTAASAFRAPRPCRIDTAVEQEFDRFSALAPLHNPQALAWIRAARDLLGADVPQVAVFEFILGMLARLGTPLLRVLASVLRPLSPTVAGWLLDSVFQQILAMLLTVASLYGIGLLASFVLGKKLFATVEGMVARLPLVQTIYGTTKRFLQALRKPPIRGQRVVLINFPSPEMKAVGFVTKVMRDAASGRELAAVYVPTSPNPTSGYIEIVPLADVVQTDWTVEEAMTFVVTGGTNAPDAVRFANSPAAPTGRP